MGSDSRPRTRDLFMRAQDVLVGGVNSPVRAFRAVGGDPLIIDRAQGARIFDMDGREYLDYVGSWGAMILGHAHDAVTASVREQSSRGTSYGMTNPMEIELAEKIRSALPSLEMIRFVSSGTEATMSAVRLARAFTQREQILKFEGCYHGHADAFLSHAGSGLATFGIASSPGVPDFFAHLTVTVPYNDFEAVEKIFASCPQQIAAVIIEPVAANMGVVLPDPGFLEALRKITKEDGTLLIFDEVITGFRLAYGGAQTIYGIVPDLTTLGKIIGGGLPVAAYGGRREIMQHLAPLGPVYQAGTLSGNPLAMRAGLASLEQLEKHGTYDGLNKKATRLVEGFRNALKDSGVPGQVNSCGSLITLFFADEPIRDFAGAKKCDTRRFAAFFGEMLSRGIFLPPSQFEALFISAAHTNDDIDRTIEACRESLKAVVAAVPAD